MKQTLSATRKNLERLLQQLYEGKLSYFSLHLVANFSFSRVGKCPRRVLKFTGIVRRDQIVFWSSDSGSDSEEGCILEVINEESLSIGDSSLIE